MIALPIKQTKGIGLSSELMITLALAIVGCIVAFPQEYVSVSNFIIGILLLPFCFFIQGAKRTNYFYLFITLLFAICSLLYQLKIFYFITIAFYILFIIELLIGEVNSLALFLMGIMSPVFLQVAVILGFPIRLQLSEWAGAMMSTAGLDIAVEGNMMVLSGFSFTVDEACMGLNMLAISLLMGIFVLIHLYRKEQRILSFGFLLLFFVSVFLLNMLSNLFRIQMLVIFKVLPENILHEIIGVACLVLYVMMPLYYIGRYFVSRWGKSIVHIQSHELVNSRLKVTGYLLGLTVMSIGFFIKPTRAEAETFHARVKYGDAVPEKLAGGITKLYDKKMLIYVKTIPEFFSGEHTPLICWKGSGYSFKKITKMNIGNQEVLYGVLAKGDNELHTAWWYTDGKMKTIDQLEWRTQMMKTGNRFCLINVTTANEYELQQELQSIFNSSELKIELSSTE